VNIILVSDSLAKSRHVTLSQPQVILVALGILLSGFMLAMATYVVTMKFAVDLRNPYLRTLLAALHEDELKRSEGEMKQNLNALAVKVGELQARIMRLDAFGVRLGKAAGIKADEFRFDEAPGQGGPAPTAGRDLSVTEFNQRLSEKFLLVKCGGEIRVGCIVFRDDLQDASQDRSRFTKTACLH